MDDGGLSLSGFFIVLCRARALFGLCAGVCVCVFYRPGAVSARAEFSGGACVYDGFLRAHTLSVSCFLSTMVLMSRYIETVTVCCESRSAQLLSPPVLL